MIRCVEVMLSIPDNEARTALATLRRLGVELADLERAELYRCDAEGAQAERLVATLRGLETIFNPNKHRLRVRDDARPGPGEVWIEEIRPASAASDTPVRVGGRTLPGVRSLDRFIVWRMYGRDRTPATPSLVGSAVETLLCNPAFQKAIR